MFEVVEFVGFGGDGCGVALSVESGAGNSAVFASCGIHKQLAGAEVLLNNLAVDSNLHIFEVECSAVVAVGLVHTKVYLNANVFGASFGDDAAPRYVSPFAVGKVVARIADAVNCSFGVDKLGNGVAPLIVFVDAAFNLARKQVDCSLVAIKSVPVDIKVELEVVAGLLSVKTCQNVAELCQPLVAIF